MQAPTTVSCLRHCQGRVLICHTGFTMEAAEAVEDSRSNRQEVQGGAAVVHLVAVVERVSPVAAGGHFRIVEGKS